MSGRERIYDQGKYRRAFPFEFEHHDHPPAHLIRDREAVIRDESPSHEGPTRFVEQATTGYHRMLLELVVQRKLPVHRAPSNLRKRVGMCP